MPRKQPARRPVRRQPPAPRPRPAGRTLAELERAKGFGPTVAPAPILGAALNAYRWVTDQLGVDADDQPPEIAALREQLEASLGRRAVACS